jgi:hypothetical protein
LAALLPGLEPETAKRLASRRREAEDCS